MEFELHPDVSALSALLGMWEGTGVGEYPTIADFAYHETITFTHVGKPFLAYTQRTRHPETGLAMHSESGYWRVPRSGSIEIVMAEPTGLAEIYEGAVVANDGTVVIDVRSTFVGATTSAKEVTITERTFSVTGDDMQYTFRMAAVGQPLQHHLGAHLRRTNRHV